MICAPSWARQDFDYLGQKDAQVNSFHADVNLVKQKNRAWDSSLNAVVTHPSGLPSLRGNTFVPGSGSSCTPQEAEAPPSAAREKQDSAAESAFLDAKVEQEVSEREIDRLRVTHRQQQQNQQQQHSSSHRCSSSSSRDLDSNSQISL